MPNELNDIAKSSARGSFFLFLGNTSSTIIMAVAAVLVARLLGPEDYGLYALAMIAPSFFIPLSDLGISPALTRFSARFHCEGKNPKLVAIIRTGIIFKSVFSLLLSLVLLLLSESIAVWVLRRPDISLLIRFTSLYLAGQAIFTTLNSIFIGLDKTENSGLLMNIQAVAKTVASLLLIILGMGALGVILGAGLGFLLATTVGVAMLLLSIHLSHNHTENISFFEGLKLLILYGMPLYLSSVIFTLLTQYRSLLLALFASNAEIGNYRTAMNFSYLITLLSYPIATSLFPAFSKLDIAEDREKVKKIFKLSVKYSSLLVVSASLAVAVLSKEAVYTLYGSQYQLAPSYLALYVLSFLCSSLGMLVVGNFFNGQGDTMTTFRIYSAKLGFTIPLAFILTYFYGVPGLLVSFLASEFLSSTYGLFLAHKKYAVTVDWGSSLRTVVAALTSALLVYIFITFAATPLHTLKLATGGFLFVTCFLVLAPLLGSINKEDVKNLDELLKGLTLLYPIARIILNIEEKILSLRGAH